MDQEILQAHKLGIQHGCANSVGRVQGRRMPIGYISDIGDIGDIEKKGLQSVQGHRMLMGWLQAGSQWCARGGRVQAPLVLYFKCVFVGGWEGRAGPGIKEPQ